MPVIKIGGRNKPAASKTRSTSSKPAARKTTTKRTAAAKRTAAKPAAKKTARKSTAGTPRGPRTPKTDPRLLKKHMSALESAGAKRRKAEEMHDEAVNAVHEAAQAAMADEVPMTIISDTLGVSRQWLYKMGEFRGRTNGSGRKSTGRATAASKQTASRRNGTASKPAAKRGTAARKPAAKKSTGRVKIGRK